MPENESQNEKIAKMTFGSVYPHYVAKIEKKGRDKAELHEVITWLTGYSEDEIDALAKTPTTFSQFFDQARMNPKSKLIKGVICGYRVEEIENPLTQKVRYLDKLVDELAKGKKLEKILRS